MKLVSYGEKGFEKPGILDAGGAIRDLSAYISDISGPILDPLQLEKIRAIDCNELPIVPEKSRIGACLAKVGKIICIGLNYTDHAAEVGKSKPPEPVVFLKASSAICGPFDPIEIPKGSVKTDWEIELAVVIGSRAKYVSQTNAMDYIAGYCCLNDISEREFQSERQGQWTKGKSHDTHAPIGPWLVTKDEIKSTSNLKLWCEIDGVMRQNSSTDKMIYGVDYLVSYLSQFMTLEPGDIIATGTPPGVGKGIKPEAIYLKPGQKLRCGVDGLGTQDHVIVSA